MDGIKLRKMATSLLFIDLKIKTSINQNLGNFTVDNELTTLLAQHKQQFGYQVPDVGDWRGEETTQFVAQCVPLLWPSVHIAQGRQDTPAQVLAQQTLIDGAL